MHEIAVSLYMKALKLITLQHNSDKRNFKPSSVATFKNGFISRNGKCSINFEVISNSIKILFSHHYKVCAIKNIKKLPVLFENNCKKFGLYWWKKNTRFWNEFWWKQSFIKHFLSILFDWKEWNMDHYYKKGKDQVTLSIFLPL